MVKTKDNFMIQNSLVFTELALRYTNKYGNLPTAPAEICRFHHMKERWVKGKQGGDPIFEALMEVQEEMPNLDFKFESVDCLYKDLFAPQDECFYCTHDEISRNESTTFLQSHPEGLVGIEQNPTDEQLHTHTSKLNPE